MKVEELRDLLYDRSINDSAELLFCDTDKGYGEGFKLNGIYISQAENKVILVMNAEF